MSLGNYSWCSAPFSGWSECPARQDCLSGKNHCCLYPERRSEYFGELSLYRNLMAEG